MGSWMYTVFKFSKSIGTMLLVKVPGRNISKAPSKNRNCPKAQVQKWYTYQSFLRCLETTQCNPTEHVQREIKSQMPHATSEMAQICHNGNKQNIKRLICLTFILPTALWLHFECDLYNSYGLPYRSRTVFSMDSPSCFQKFRVNRQIYSRSFEAQFSI